MTTSVPLQLPDKRRNLQSGVALMLLAYLAYLPALKAGFIWDDDLWLLECEAIRTAGGLFDIWFRIGTILQYYPMVSTTFWLEHLLWGFDPAGYHGVNIFLHSANAILVWRILLALGIRPAWFIAAVFCLHPVHVESVAWITERKNVLSGFFYLAAMQCFLRSPIAFRTASGHAPQVRSMLVDRRYLGALFLFVLALLSKSVTCTLPVVLLLLLVWKHGRIPLMDAFRLAPFFILGAALGLLTVWMEKSAVGAQGTDWDFTWIERCLIAGCVSVFYLIKLVAPLQLTFFYPRWEIDGGRWELYLAPLAVLTLVVFLWVRRKQWGFGPLAAILYFLVTLFPALGFFAVYPMRYSFVADHFQYLASIGPLALILAAGHHWLARGVLDGRARGLAAGGILAVLGLLTWNQARIYQDVETLWKDTIRKNPGAWMAYNNLGMEYLNRGEIEAAMSQFEESLKVKENQVEVRYNMGLAQAKAERYKEAIDWFQEALEIDPTYRKAYINLGNSFLASGNARDAISAYEKAIELLPDAISQFNLGNTYIQSGTREEGIRHLKQAIQIAPDFAEAHNNLGLQLGGKGQWVEAISHFQKAVELAPANALFKANLERSQAFAGQTTP